MIIILGINRLGVFGGGIQITEMKMNRKFNTFTDLKSLELEVPKTCLVTGCVSARRDRRYSDPLDESYMLCLTAILMITKDQEIGLIKCQQSRPSSRLFRNQKLIAPSHTLI